MTRKDYIKIAKIVKDNSDSIVIIDRLPFIDALCDMFKEDNELFYKGKFIDACNDE